MRVRREGLVVGKGKVNYDWVEISTNMEKEREDTE